MAVTGTVMYVVRFRKRRSLAERSTAEQSKSEGPDGSDASEEAVLA
jgi:hypothetical protein